MSVGKDNGLVQKKIMELSCLVQVTGQDPKLVKAKSSPFYKADDGLTTISASGIVLPQDGPGGYQQRQIVLSSASIIWPFLREEYRHNIANAAHGDLLPETDIRINTESQNFNCARETTEINVVGKLLGFLKVPKVTTVELDGNHVGWNLIKGFPRPAHTLQTLAEHIALFETEISSLNNSPFGVTWGKGHPGMEVFVIGSPFGCMSSYHFMNCLVHSNLVKKENSGYLSVPGYLLPGMEGGVVVSRIPQTILGVLSLPLNGAPLLIPMRAIFEALSEWSMRHKRAGVVKQKELHIPAVVQSFIQQDLQSSLRKGVVKLRTFAGTWGSGIVINKSPGIIITCSHLFEESSNMSKNEVVGVFYPGLGWSKGRLIYQFSGFLDVAVIHISRKPSILQKVQIWNGDYGTLRGRACCAVGFGLEERQSLRVDHTVNFGNISKAVYHQTNNECLMLISAVHVFPGSSGGALFLPSGHLVGLITGNTVYTDGRSISHCSFSIPMSLLRELYGFQWDQGISQYKLKLRDLDVDDEQSSLIWRLTTKNTNPKRALPGGKSFNAFMEKLGIENDISEENNHGHVSKL